MQRTKPMDSLRLYLWMAFAALLYVSWLTWESDFAPVPAPATTAQDPGIPSDPDADLPGLPAAPELPASEEAPTAQLPTQLPDSTGTIQVRTDVLDLKIDLAGGDIRGLILPAYPVEKDRPDEPIQLLSRDPGQLFIYRTGIRAADEQPEANHTTSFSSSAAEFELSAGQTELIVPLVWDSGSGIVVEKIYTFRPGRYDVELKQIIRNNTEQEYRFAPYLQIQRDWSPPERSMFNVDSYSFTGPVAYDGEKYDKLDPEDLLEEPFEQTVIAGWIASIQHHFLAAAVPPPDETWNYRTTFDGRSYVLSSIGPLTGIPPGGSVTAKATLFAGPKVQSQLNEVSDGLSLTVDYGVLTILAQPLFWVLDKVYGLVGNWGWAIIIVTFLIKLVFYKLTETSGRSMAKMRKLQPRLKQLQERYKDDRQAMSQKLMELYKREKVNPAAGCLPMLVQIPFFIAFYWVLLESVEMRQAPFALWITDLSSRDPFFILPLLMGAAMFVQQKLNPAPPDPVQAKVMMMLPLMFTVFFAFFPAGLVLYWLTNSVLSILQQWKINKVVEAEA